jgi:hypothetical protein
MAIAACFAFQREISSSVLWDFFDSIGQKRHFDRARSLPVFPYEQTSAAPVGMSQKS